MKRGVCYPIVETVLESLSVTNEERGLIQERLEQMVRERAGASGIAKLSNPINIGLGTK